MQLLKLWICLFWFFGIHTGILAQDSISPKQDSTTAIVVDSHFFKLPKLLNVATVSSKDKLYYTSLPIGNNQVAVVTNDLVLGGFLGSRMEANLIDSSGNLGATLDMKGVSKDFNSMYILGQTVQSNYASLYGFQRKRILLGYINYSRFTRLDFNFNSNQVQSKSKYFLNRIQLKGASVFDSTLVVYGKKDFVPPYVFPAVYIGLYSLAALHYDGDNGSKFTSFERNFLDIPVWLGLVLGIPIVNTLMPGIPAEFQLSASKMQQLNTFKYHRSKYIGKSILDIEQKANGGYLYAIGSSKRYSRTPLIIENRNADAKTIQFVDKIPFNTQHRIKEFQFSRKYTSGIIEGELISTEKLPKPQKVGKSQIRFAARNYTYAWDTENSLMFEDNDVQVENIARQSPWSSQIVIKKQIGQVKNVPHEVEYSYTRIPEILVTQYTDSRGRTQTKQELVGHYFSKFRMRITNLNTGIYDIISIDPTTNFYIGMNESTPIPNLMGVGFSDALISVFYFGNSGDLLLKQWNMEEKSLSKSIVLRELQLTGEERGAILHSIQNAGEKRVIVVNAERKLRDKSGDKVKRKENYNMEVFTYEVQ